MRKEELMKRNKQTPVFPTVLAVLLTLLLFLTACGSDPEVEFNGDADSEPRLSYLTLGGGSTDGNPAIVVIGFDAGDEASWAESRIELDHVRLFESLQDAPRIYGSTDGRLSVPLAAAVPVALRFQPPTETAFKRLDLAGGYATDAAAISLVVKKSGLSREVLLPDGLPFTLTDSVTPWRAGERYHYVVRLPLADWLEGTGTEDGGDVILYHDPNRNGRLDAGEDAESHIAGRVRISDPSSCDPNCEARSACDQVALGLCQNDDPAEMSWPTCIDGHLYDCLTPPGSECCDGVGRVPLPVGVCATEHVCDSATDGDDGGDGDIVEDDGDNDMEGDLDVDGDEDGDNDGDTDPDNDVENDTDEDAPAVLACLDITPDPLQFGSIQMGCSESREITLANACDTTVTIVNLALQSGEMFSLQTLFSLPIQMPPGTSVAVTVEIVPPMAESYVNQLDIELESGEMNDTRMIPISASGTSDHKADLFELTGSVRADILFVQDCSGSMAEELPTLRAAYEGFLRPAMERNPDLNVAMTSADPQRHGGLFQGQPAVLHAGEDGLSLDETLDALMARAEALGSDCSGMEGGLTAAAQALTEPNISQGNAGFLRQDAQLILAFVSDESHQSEADQTAYAGFIQTLGQVSLEPVSVSPPGGCPDAGGRAARAVCNGEYVVLFRDLAEAAFEPQTRFALTEEPVTDSLQVFLNDAPASGWSYQADDNSVLFSVEQTPPFGSQVLLDYTMTCPERR